MQLGEDPLVRIYYVPGSMIYMNRGADDVQNVLFSCLDIHDTDTNYSVARRKLAYHLTPRTVMIRTDDAVCRDGRRISPRNELEEKILRDVFA